MPFDVEVNHGSASDELEELAAAFALEALASSEERADYAAHLGYCTVCHTLVGEFQTVTDLLPETLDEQPASAGLKSRILSEAGRDLTGIRDWRTGNSPHPSSPNPQSPVPSPYKGWGWPSWLSPVPALAIAVLVLALVGLAAWNISLQIALNQRPEATPEQQALIDALASGASVIALAGTDAAPSSSARLVQTPGSDRAFLVVNNLTPLPANQAYQVWRIENSTPQGVGTFDILDSQVRIVSLQANFSEADAIGVSIEPEGGSSAPTGDIVLLGMPSEN